MKITVITSLAGPGSVAGGVWEVVVNQVSALRTAGHDVTLVAGWLGKNPPTDLRGLPMRLVSVRPLVKPMGLRLLMGPGWIRTVRKALQGADLVHVHVCRDALSLSAVQLANRAGIPIVAQPHGMLSAPRTPLFQAFDRFATRPALAKVAHFVTLTDAEVPHLASFGVRSVGSTTIHNAVPTPKHTWSRPQGPHRLLFASRLHPRKQVLVFARAVKRLRELGHDVQGIIAGADQGDLPELQKFYAQAPDGYGLHYVGQLRREQLDIELSRASAFVFPALDEPFGLVLVEAMSIGTPVVSTTETPLMDAIRQAKAARFAPPTVEAMTDSLAGLLSSPTEQETLSYNGRRLYQQHWTNEVMVQKLTGMYDAIIRRDRAEAGRA